MKYKIIATAVLTALLTLTTPSPARGEMKNIMEITQKEWDAMKNHSKLVFGRVVIYAGSIQLVKKYDLNGDKIPDFAERYIIGKEGEGNPFLYGFDSNRDGYISDKEIAVDERRDRINGNEVRFDEYKRKHPKKEFNNKHLKRI